MVTNSLKLFLFGILFVVGVLMGAGVVSAAYCWDYDDDDVTCNAQSDCIYHYEPWGGWCEELNCWSLSLTECANTSIMTLIGKDCQWKDSNDYGWCQQTSCWSFKSTNVSYCENSTANGGLNCEWSAQCTGWNDIVNCWDLTTVSECGNYSGCSWGECMDVGCWNYWDSTSCGNANGSRGGSCVWDSTNNYCYEPSCWDYGGSSSNVSYCESNPESLDCVWIDNYYVKESCEEKQCWHYDYTNETYCEDSSATGLNCTWDGGQYCMMQGCWNYNTEGSCDAESSCSWETSTGGGWCEEVQCWSWDSWNGGNQTDCENNSYNLSCAWDGGGGCYPDIGDQVCANFSSERDCMDTYYCWWIWDDWNNVSAGGSCQNPDWSGMNLTSNDAIFAEWNPGCYIFDMNSTDCGKVIGCDNSTAGACDTNSTHLYNTTIDDTGLNCTMMNDSQLCNNIPALSTCCEWSNGVCQNKLDKSCWENADREQQELGVTACEDVSMQTSSSETGESLCQQIAGYPLFMPCVWDNSTNTCSFKSSDVFGNRTQSFALIDNKKNCDASGGKWIQEWYCEGNRSIPAGRCEQKGGDEKNCDKACFACDYDFNGANHTDAPTAKEYCYGSKLGYCGFTSDTSAPNGFGLCRAKEEFVSGIAGDCKTSCGGCTYLGNPTAATYSDANPAQNIPTSYDICNTPKCYCEYAKEFSNVNCKWVSDSTSDIGGYCVDSSEKICADACDRCYARTSCLEDGRGAFNASGSCSWSNSDSETDGTCTKIAGGDGVAEICWDGVDNDNDNAIDCADSECYSDSFCGFVSGDCFGWMTEATCEAAQLDSGMNCTWVSDPWGSWCDFPGMDCWKYDGNQSGCGGAILVANETLNISAARLDDNNINTSHTFSLTNTGSGWVNGSIIILNATGFNINGNYSVDLTAQTISFANNTFMVDGGGSGNITNVTYQYYPDASLVSCDWSAGTGDGWCEQDWSMGQDCYNLMSESTCDGGDNCTWTNDTWCDGDGAEGDWCTTQGGWCDPAAFAPKGCWQRDNTNSTYCENLSGCYYEGTWCMEQGCWNYDGNSTACDVATDCSWETDDWQRCEVDWSANCWQFDSNSTYCEANGCSWRTGTWGDWCDNKFSACWDLDSSSCSGNSNCAWCADCWDWNTQTNGMCEAKCFNGDLTSVTCGLIDGCRWMDGWCNSDSYSTDSNLDCGSQANSTLCGDTTGCKWKDTGWCNPKGFVGGDALGGMGGGAVTGMECWKYDGNETACGNSSLIGMTCAWMQEYRPFCEPDWSADCWKYYDNETADANGYVCGNSSGCYWTESYCSNVFDECWNNIAYSNDTNSSGALSNSGIACNANANCNWTDGSWDTYYNGTGWCEPSCFSAGTEGECSDSCRWMNGFCNTPGMSEMFGGMEMGAPVMIAIDAMGDSSGEAYTELMGAGMKDMDDSFGFASGTANFADAGICNGEKVGFGMGNSFGQGNATVKYYVYLDTDGSTTGNCKLSDNSSASGYEFFFSYESTYNGTLGKATETFSAQKCSSTNWVTADISLSAWKEKMCGEVQGPMVAVKKSALEKFPVLYDSATDMRVYVASAGADNNASSPSDTAGPGWVTPGAIDFPIMGFFDLGASGAIFENILMGGGFVQYEDCFNEVDDNNDGLVDCADWNCEFAPHCSASDRAADTSMPIIDGVKVEEYFDAALIMYNTNKPTNGTLTFYGNDSTCSTINTTIYDLGVNVSSVRTHKLWHYAKIYNDSGVYSLNYPLSNDTTYYYKLKVCDSAAKCSVSACTSFRTAESSSKCGYCNFVTIISPPTGWIVNYDLNSDGTYEHVQGQMCGPSAGMKTSYVTGRKANVKLNNSNGAEMIFLNVTLTKTGLTGDTRTISTTGDLIYDTSLTDSSGGALGMVGMTSATRDKIINNLHPEVCKIKMPNDDCTKLYHCDNSGDNCVDITSSATGVQSGTSCLWTIPYCDF